MKKYILYIIAVILSFVGCQENLEALDAAAILPEGQTLVVSLPIEDSDTRVEFVDGEGIISLDWETGDIFTVYDSVGNCVADFEYYSTRSDNSSIFTAVSDINPLTIDDDYTAIFPAIENITTLTAHRAALANRVVEQTQIGGNNSHHLNYALRMESQFNYAAQDNTIISFEHSMATMRISFSLEDNATPTKLVFHDANSATYTIDVENAEVANSYSIYYVIDPIEESDRTISFIITPSSCDERSFSINSEISYQAGRCYAATLTDLTTIPNGYTPIYTALDMYNIRNDLSGNYILMNDIDLYTYSNWTPIGSTSSASFTGTFDGGGYTIRNLTINSSNSHRGLFGYINGGSISNLIIENQQVQGDSYTGAICGYASNSTISNCGVFGGSVVGEFRIGGVVGDANSSKIMNCYNTGLVSGSGSSVGGIVGCATSSQISACYNIGAVTGDAYVGGIVGLAYYASSFPITACYNTGHISGGVNIGGVVGYAYSSRVIACYNIGVISGRYGDNGGVVGYTTNEVVACYYVSGMAYNDYGTKITTLSELNDMVQTMNTEAGRDYFSVNDNCILPSLLDEEIYYEDHDPYIENMTISTIEELCLYRDLSNSGWGPQNATLTTSLDFSGSEWSPIQLYGATFNGNGNTISNVIINDNNDYQGFFSYVNGGSISNLTLNNVHTYGGSSSGILCGCLYKGNIYNCGITKGSASGNSYIGGIVGESYGSSIASCYSNSSILGDGDYVGGITGLASNTTVSTCYSKGSVSGSQYIGGLVGETSSSSNINSCYNISSTSGNDYVGGIIGYIYSDTYFKSYATACYNIGIIEGVTYFGGITGYSSYSSSIVNCYYLLPYNDVGYISNYGTADENLTSVIKSSEAISTLNTAAGDTYWGYDTNNINDGYPILVNINYE